MTYEDFYCLLLDISKYVKISEEEKRDVLISFLIQQLKEGEKNGYKGAIVKD